MQGICVQQPPAVDFVAEEVEHPDVGQISAELRLSVAVVALLRSGHFVLNSCTSRSLLSCLARFRISRTRCRGWYWLAETTTH
jgi:hypothetical protein